MMKNEEHTSPAVYFKSLTIENVRCFKSKQTIDFTDKNGEPAQWTVILGNNNTGKTTLLRVLESLIIIDIGKVKGEELFENYRNSRIYYWLDLITENSYSRADFNIYLNNNLISKNIEAKSLEGFGVKFPSNFKKEELDLVPLVSYFLPRKINQHYSATLLKPESYDVLINPEEWLIQTAFAAKNGVKKAEKRLKKMKAVLVKILPDVQDFKFVTDEETFKSHVEVLTDYGWVKINELGYGYQTLMAWVVDLAKKMFDRYPNSEYPLREPAIVLVDEIDLHLHPEWQRKIVSWLSEHFPATQFIVTAHSPLVVQSADSVNVVLLRKEGDEVKIEQPNISTFKGWTVEEILSDLMGLNDRTHSEAYLRLMEQFDAALDKDDYENAKAAYDELEQILHPRSPQRKLLKLQMTSLTPPEFIEI